MTLCCSNGIDGIKKMRGKLILHLDINGVVIGQENINGDVTSPNVYANIMLANGTYYKWTKDTPQQSFKQYVWNNLCPGKNSDVELRKKRKNKLKNFVKDLTQENHYLAGKVTQQYERLVEILKDSSVFPGFDKLLDTLNEKQIDYNIVFRTFGNDGEYIKQYLKAHYANVRFLEGSFNVEGKFTYINHNNEKITINTPDEFEKLMNEGNNWLIQDNFSRWQDGNELGRYGKLFTFSSTNYPTISLFFDDNLEIVSDQERTIVGCYDVSRKEFVSTKQASLYLHKVNPIDAALNADYLITKVNEKVQSIIFRTNILNRKFVMRVACASLVIFFAFYFRNLIFSSAEL